MLYYIKSDLYSHCDKRRRRKETHSTKYEITFGKKGGVEFETSIYSLQVDKFYTKY